MTFCAQESIIRIVISLDKTQFILRAILVYDFDVGRTLLYRPVFL